MNDNDYYPLVEKLWGMTHQWMAYNHPGPIMDQMREILDRVVAKHQKIEQDRRYGVKENGVALWI